MSSMICLTPVKEKQYYQAFTMKDGKEYILQLVTSTDIVDTFQRDEMKAILENMRRNPPKFNDGTLLDVNKFNIVGTRMKVPIEQERVRVKMDKDIRFSIHLLPMLSGNYYAEVCKYKDVFHEDCKFHSECTTMDEAYRQAKEFIKNYKE